MSSQRFIDVVCINTQNKNTTLQWKDHFVSSNVINRKHYMNMLYKSSLYLMFFFKAFFFLFKLDQPGTKHKKDFRSAFLV